jgi:hypothetical protein
MSRWMHWLMTTYVRRSLGRYRSSGHVWQGRFKAFPIQEDDRLLALLRYIERNPLRGGLVGRAEEWAWSSLRWLSAPEQAPLRLEQAPIGLDARRWLSLSIGSWTTGQICDPAAGRMKRVVTFETLSLYPGFELSFFHSGSWPKALQFFFAS